MLAQISLDFLALPLHLDAHSFDFSPEMVEVWHGSARRVEGRIRTKAEQKGKPLGLVVRETEHPNRPPEALEPNARPRWAPARISFASGHGDDSGSVLGSGPAPSNEPFSC